VTARRILVPLDGSLLAEAVLPAALSLAQRLEGTLLLVHVLEREPPKTVHGEAHLATAEEAQLYLDGHAQRLHVLGVEVEVHVHERPVGDVAAALDRHAHELEADLIAMCAHGRSNLRDRLLGSIAERILRGGSIPILLRTVREPDAGEFRLRNLLVPLDFGHDVDAALSAARLLAAAYGATVTLLSVPETASPATERLLPSASALARELERADVGRRLEGLAETLRIDLPEVQAVVLDQRPAEAIIETAASLPADLIVLVTDAHGGLATWYDPPTGQQLLARPDLTLLLMKEL
jgi:nucleotide-binding universal stress UspA family protein